MDRNALRTDIVLDPHTQNREVLEAAADDAELRALLEIAREVDDGLHEALDVIPVPQRLRERLMALPDIDDGADVATTREPEPHAPQLRAVFQRFRVAIALAVIILIASGFSLFLPGPGG
jgi:hypothetical protein